MILLKFQKNMKYNKLSKKKLSLDFTMTIFNNQTFLFQRK